MAILTTLVVSSQDAYAMTTGLKSPTSHSTSGDVFDWNNPLNVYSGSDALAHSQGDNNFDQAYGGFAFGVPNGATIDGITVSVKAQGHACSSGASISVKLSDPTLVVEASTSGQFTSVSKSTSDYGTSVYSTEILGSTSDVWGNTYTSSQINDLQVLLTSHCTFNDSTHMDIDHLQVTVEYTLADIIPPVITLEGSTPITIEANVDTYSELGATCEDDVDGEIDGNIVIGGDTVDESTVGIYIVDYDCDDSVPNPATTVQRTVNVVDTTAPIVSLVGSTPITIVEGVDEYEEQGATCVDITEGQINSSVVIGGDTVDESTIAQYIVDYDCDDSVPNSATTVQRTVDVVALTCNEGFTPINFVCEAIPDCSLAFDYDSETNLCIAFTTCELDEWLDDQTNECEVIPECNGDYEYNPETNQCDYVIPEDCSFEYENPIITSLVPTSDGAVIEWTQDRKESREICFDPLGFDVESGTYLELNIEGGTSGTATITGLSCGTFYDVEVSTDWRFHRDTTAFAEYETLACTGEELPPTEGDCSRAYEDPIITSIDPTIDGAVVTWIQDRKVFFGICFDPRGFEIESGSYFETDIEGDTSGTATITGLSCGTEYDVEVSTDWIFHRDTTDDDTYETLACEVERSGGGSTCHVSPTFGTPFTCDRRNFVDDGITIHGTSYDPENQLHIENPQINAVVGIPYTIELKPYDSFGEFNIKWVAVSLGLVEGDFVFGNGEAIVYLHQAYDGTFSIEEDDDNNIINVINFVKSRDMICADEDNDALCPVYRLDYMYNQAPIGNMIGVQVVNQDRESESRFFNDGIDVTGDSLNPSPIIEVLAKEKFVALHYLTYADPSFKDRTVAIDENGKTWYQLSNGIWYTEYVIPDKSCNSSSSGYAKHCPEFAMMKQGQELVAQHTFDTMYPRINMYESFYEIDRIFAYEYSSISQRELTLQTLDWYNAN